MRRSRMVGRAVPGAPVDVTKSARTQVTLANRHSRRARDGAPYLHGVWARRPQDAPKRLPSPTKSLASESLSINPPRLLIPGDPREPPISLMQSVQTEIRTIPQPRCLLCGTEGDYLYRNLVDSYFDAPGKWDFKQCPNEACGLIWLDPFPMAQDLHLAYSRYFTHGEG